MSALNTYDVMVNGIQTRMKLTEEQAKRIGANKSKGSSKTSAKSAPPEVDLAAATVEVEDATTPAPAKKTYELEVNGVTTTMKLSDEDAVRYGVAKPEPAPKATMTSQPAKKPARKRAVTRSRARK